MQIPKIKIPKKYLKIGAWVLGVFLVVCIALGAVAYSKREALLKKMVAKAIARPIKIMTWMSKSDQQVSPDSARLK